MATDTRERFRISEEAALWLVRLEQDGSPECRTHFTAWARQSPVHVEEFLFARATSQHLANVDPHFKQVFDQFVSTKKSCGEPVTGLTYPKFAEKLVKNREDLMQKTGCRDVRFTVYVKDGKAALKATPVKDDA